MRDRGRLGCEGCDFDFADAYGERGKGYMEVHHTRPVHEIKPGHVTRLADLALVCANCHRMIHARRPWLKVEELRRSVRRGS
jgi:5-methylcytosine-specific restriction enzyme A